MKEVAGGLEGGQGRTKGVEEILEKNRGGEKTSYPTG